MRKLSLLLVVLLAAGSAGLYGQMAINTEFEISGDATATLGYNLDHQKLGFKNEFSSNISLTLVPKMSSSNPMDMGMDSTGWIGVIELKDFRIIIDEGHDDVHKTSEDTSAATAGTGGAAAGPSATESMTGDGSVMYPAYPHSHGGTIDGSETPAIIAPAAYFTTTNPTYPGVGTSLGDITDSGYTGYVMGTETKGVADPANTDDNIVGTEYTGPIYAKITHTHELPSFADAGAQGSRVPVFADDAGTADVDESTRPRTGPGSFTRPNDECSTRCVARAGGNVARTGVSEPADDQEGTPAVPVHYHLVTAMDRDDNDEHFDEFDISEYEIPALLPHSHTHNTENAGHTHDTHAHGPHEHGAHSHEGVIVIKNPTVTAKLINGPLSIQIYSAPENKAGLVDPVEDDEDGDHLAESDDDDLNVDLGGHGITLGYDTEGLGIAVGISSELAYDEPEDNADTEEDESARKGDWYINGDINVDIGPATIDLQVVQTIKGDDSDPTVGPETGFGAKITGNLGDLSLSAGGDIVLTGATDTTAASTDYELGAGLGFALTDTTTMDADYIYSTDKDVASDVEVSLEDTAGIIENLSFALSWGLYDLSNGNPDNEDKGHNDKLDMMVGVNLGYGFEALGGKLTPSIDVKYNRLDSDKAVVDTEVKLVLTEAIPQAELGMKWKSDSLFDPDNDSLGVLTAWTKVSY